jgi:hypothetical protein
MVPGMTERERLAADVRLCAWLADARFGPALTAVSPMARVTVTERPLELPRRLVRGALAVARGIGWWLRPIPVGTFRLLPKRGIVPLQ